jgi:hypothetical protein
MIEEGALHLVYLNGWTLLPAIRKAMAGHPVAILGRNFAFRPTRFLLNWLADHAERRGLFRALYDVCPELAYYREFLGYSDRTDIFTRTLKAQSDLYRFDHINAQTPDYAIAAKHAACNNTRLLTPVIVQLGALEGREGSNRLSVSGVDRDALSLFAAYHGRKPKPGVSARIELRRIVNALHGLMLLIYGVAWIFAHTRTHPTAAPRRHRLAADFTGANDRRGFQLVREVTESPADVLYVFRRTKPSAKDVAAVAEYDRAAVGNGKLEPIQAVRALGQLVCDTVRLSRLALDGSPELFVQTVAMPLRRLAFRAFFNDYPCEFFLARDDYNSEHSLRSQELRKIGGRSLGIMHAIPSDNDEEPSMWFVDFDYYYCFGKRTVEHHPEWPTNMLVRLTGAWAMSRAHVDRLSEPRPKNFIFFGRGGLREGSMIAVVRQIAAAFPDRTVYLKLKAGSRRYPPDMPIVMRNLPANVVIVDPDEDTYELMFHAQYAFSAGSTVIAEALHYGLKAFVFDLHPELPFVFRNFPGLIVKSADEMIRQVRTIEAGEGTYDPARFNDLINMSGPAIFDAIRADMSSALPSSA